MAAYLLAMISVIATSMPAYPSCMDYVGKHRYRSEKPSPAHLHLINQSIDGPLQNYYPLARLSPKSVDPVRQMQL